MVKIRLNKMGLSLSPLAIGCEPLGKTDWGFVNVSDCKKAIKKAFDKGVNVFDTADVYGLGRSEIELSNALGKDSMSIYHFKVRYNTATTNRLRRAKTLT